MCGVWALSVGVSSDFWVWRGTDTPGSVPWPPEQVCHSSDDRGTQFGTGHLVLAVWRAGWVWRGAWALSFGNRRLRYDVIPMTEALILGLGTWT